MRYIVFFAALVLRVGWGASGIAGATAGAAATMPALPEHVAVAVNVYPDEIVRPISPQFIGTNLTQYKTDRAQVKVPATLERVRGLGVRTIRFPNGCFADLYNWQSPKPEEMTVEEFIDFCDAIDAEPYYTFNMQGGTEGLEGTPPAPAPLEEAIRYRHTAPNPCGYTNYYFGTLPEALALFGKYTIERALAGQTPILHYELGNENWGQAKTDWTPPVYGKNAEVWCRALRDAWAQAQSEHERLHGMRLWIVAVGFPTMGNNQDPLKAVDQEVNRAWTAEINRLADAQLIDAVTEHFYPFPSNTGDSMYWTVHNLHNLLALRAGAVNERLGGYRDASLAYRVPIEVTEWNLKCWGRNRIRWDLPLRNGDFEKSMEGWAVEAGGAAGARATPAAARRGKLGLELRAPGPGDSVTVRQRFSTAQREKAAALGAYLWVRTPTPGQVRIAVGPAGGASEPLKGVPERSAGQTNMWERLGVLFQPAGPVPEVEWTLTVRGPGGSAFVDELVPAHWETFSDNVPPAVDRYEQQLFAVDALREMLAWPITRTHWHHLFGNYGCPQLQADGAPRDNAAAFQLLAGRIGRELVRTDCDSPTFSYDTRADALATDFNAVSPDMCGIPALSALATRDGERLFVLLVNRTTDRRIATRLRVHGAGIAGAPRVRTMSGRDLDLPGVTIADRELPPAELDSHPVAPLSAQVVELRLR